jgi:hypothetical protein
MSADSQFNFPGQTVNSVAGNNVSIFDLQHGIFGSTGEFVFTGPALAEGGNVQAPEIQPLDSSGDAAAPSVHGDALFGSTADANDGGGYHGAEAASTSTGHTPSDHTDAFLLNDATFVDHPQDQLASFTSDVAASGWAGTFAVNDAPAQYFTSDLPAAAAGTSVEPGAFAWFFDAKGGNSGSHGGGGGGPGGGGGGGGSGGGLLTSYTSGDPNVSDASEFNIHIDFGGSWTSQEQAIVTWAADLWSTIITADVRDDTDLSGNLVDDVAIAMSIGRIDGSGNPLTGDILAQTQITAVRDPGSVDQWLPVTSSIELDSTDLRNSIKQGWSGTWDTIVLHEMGHALGFAGIIFDNLGLVDGFGNFVGANAVAAYGMGTSVPLEQDGGSGTAGSHWDEATFAPNGVTMSNEVMTGYVVQNEQTLLSDTTVAAMSDLGYGVQDPSVGSYLTIDNHLLLA